MTNIKKLFKKALLKLFFPHSSSELESIFIKEAYNFWKLTSKYNASHHTEDDIEKMQYTILRENHVIEKGMSMRYPKKGFGQQKVLELLNKLQKYADKYSDRDVQFLRYPISTILTYINYTKESGTDIPEIELALNNLIKTSGLNNIHEHAGVAAVSRQEILNKCNTDFESLLLSRHSIRYFSQEPVQDELIQKALNMAQRTPSACNRQAWKTHVFQGTASVNLVKWQSGARGFEEECRNTILVTSDLKGFLYYETHQAYIDGGLYAMNLINALHSLGLGCIPLSCGFDSSKLKMLKDFGIPENEVPILIIAFGNLLDEFKIAVSSRKDIELTNTLHTDTGTHFSHENSNNQPASQQQR